MGISNIYKVVKVIFTPILSIFFKIEVRGAENIPFSGRFLLCSNHISNVDPILLAMVLKRQIFFMAKEELFRNKILGKIIKVLGAFPVKRGKGDFSALNTAQNILKNGNILGIFIEGTRSTTGELLKPKSGAAILSSETYSKIVPVFIRPVAGNRVKLFRKVIVSFGKTVYPEDLNLKDQRGTSIRAASRFIMSKITELKDKSYSQV